MDKLELKTGIIGFGHMGRALFKGLKNAGFRNIITSNKAEDNIKVFDKVDWVFLSVKPNKVIEILEKISVQSSPKLLISLVAGIKLQMLQQLVKGKNIKVVRIMPSLAIQNSHGIIGMYGENQQLKEKLSALGEVVEISNEKDLDILTIISGCSPAILAYLAQSFSNFSGKSEKLIIKSLIGSLIYIEQSGLTFNEVIKAVATKGGITENILNFLKERMVENNVEAALKGGYKKLQEVSNLDASR